jgi:hypothetical protein
MSFDALTLCVASQLAFIVVVLFRYRLSPETFEYTLVYLHIVTPSTTHFASPSIGLSSKKRHWKIHVHTTSEQKNYECTNNKLPIKTNSIYTQTTKQKCTTDTNWLERYRSLH